MSIKVAREIVKFVREHSKEEFENDFLAVLLEPMLRELNTNPTGKFHCYLVDENTLHIVQPSAYLSSKNNAINGIEVKSKSY